MDKPALLAAVSKFDAGDEGEVPAKFLRDDALDAHPQVRTHIYCEAGSVDGFYSLRMGEVTLHQKHQKQAQASRPTIGAATILYAARRPGSKVHRAHIEFDAIGVTLIAREQVGVSVLAFEPGSGKVAEDWRDEGWRNSQTALPHDPSLRRMWLRLDAYK